MDILPGEEHKRLEAAIETRKTSELFETRADATATILRLATDAQFLCVRLKASNYMRDVMSVHVHPSDHIDYLRCTAVDGNLVEQSTS